MIKETRTKSCRYNSKGSVHLTFYNCAPLIEIRFDGQIISTMTFPDSPSGLAFAKRVFNGLQ